MKIKVSEAVGPTLDWLVLKAQGAFDLHLQNTYGTKTAWVFLERDDEDPERVDKHYLADCSASTDWNIGGPIIEREWSELTRQRTRMALQGVSFDDDGVLVGSMRCFVASRLGDEVEVPDDLA